MQCNSAWEQTGMQWNCETKADGCRISWDCVIKLKDCGMRISGENWYELQGHKISCPAWDIWGFLWPVALNPMIWSDTPPYKSCCKSKNEVNFILLSRLDHVMSTIHIIGGWNTYQIHCLYLSALLSFLHCFYRVLSYWVESSCW